MNEAAMPHVTVHAPQVRKGALTRVAKTGIYLVRGLSPELQRTARARARRESTSLTWVLEQALREYTAGTWTPRPRRQEI